MQREIDRLHAAGDLPEPASVDFIRWLHRAFYEDAPEAMLLIEGSGPRAPHDAGRIPHRRRP